MTSIPAVVDRLTRDLADRYTVLRELGRGGMATVYLARDVRHERDVAIKVLHPDLGAVLGAERFLSEIKTTAKLQHPHILPLLDSGAVDGLLYYVMPLVTGETLRARLDRERQLPVEDAVRLAREVAAALEHAHKQGIIHRDVKPENILLQDGAAVVADFGIALAVSNAGGQRVTQTGLSLGTPQYMSPEQATGDRVIDARADIYSLGTVLYEMLSGEPPHTGTTAQAVIARLLTEEPRALGLTRKQVPEHVDAAVHRALEKLPADRFASAREFAEALEGRGRPTTHASRTTRSGSATRRRSGVLVALAGVLVTGVTGGFLAGRGNAGATTDAARDAASPRPLIPIEVAIPDSLGVLGLGTSAVLHGAIGDRVLILSSQGAFVYSLTNRTFTKLSTPSGFRVDGISPEGTWVTERTSGGPLRVMPVGGGAIRTIGDSLAFGFPDFAWQGDSVLVFSQLRSESSQRRSESVDVMRQRVGAGGPGPERLVSIPKGDSIVGVSPLTIPGSSHLVLMLGILRGQASARAVSSHLTVLDTDERTLVELEGQLPTGHRLVGVLAGGVLVSLSGGYAHASVLDIRARRIGPPVQIASVEGTPTMAYGSLVTHTASASALAIITVTGRLRSLPGTERATIGQHLSPDGRTIAYRAKERNGQTTINTYALPDGPVSRIAAEPEGRPIVPYVRWAVDGQSLYFSDVACSCLRTIARDGTRTDTLLRSHPWLVASGSPVPGGTQLLVLLNNQLQLFDLRRRAIIDTILALDSASGRLSSPTVSPDARWIAYTQRPPGRGTQPELFIRSMRHGPQSWRIPADRANSPVWSRSGRSLYFLAGDTLRVAELDFTPDPAVREIRTITRLPGLPVTFDVLPGDAGFLIIAPVPQAKQRVVVLVNFADEVARLLGRPPATR